MLYVNKFRKNGDLQMESINMAFFFGIDCLLIAVGFECTHLDVIIKKIG